MEEKEQLTKLSSETRTLCDRLDIRKNVILNGEHIYRKEIGMGMDYVKNFVILENPEELTRESIESINGRVNEGLSKMRNGYRIIDRNFLCGIDSANQIIEIFYSLKGIKVKKIEPRK